MAHVSDLFQITFTLGFVDLVPLPYVRRNLQLHPCLFLFNTKRSLDTVSPLAHPVCNFFSQTTAYLCGSQPLSLRQEPLCTFFNLLSKNILSQISIPIIICKKFLLNLACDFIFSFHSLYFSAPYPL